MPLEQMEADAESDSEARVIRHAQKCMLMKQDVDTT